MTSESGTTPRVDVRLSWIIVGLGLVLAGCGAGAAVASDDPRSLTDAPAPAAMAIQDAPGVSEALPADTVVSPIADFIDGPGNDLSTLAEIHQGTAKCMQDLGWDYIAPDLSVLDGSKSPSTLGALREWTATYGYGITTQPGQGSAIREAIDAQDAYQAQRGPEARARYLSDLHGPDGTDEGAPICADRPGCAAQAERDAYADVPAADGTLLEVLGGMLEDIWASEEYVAALNRWHTCISDQGLDFARKGDAKRTVLDRIGTSSDLEALQAYELRVATADLACAESTLLPMAIPLEAQVVGELVARFPEYAAAGDR